MARLVSVLYHLAAGHAITISVLTRIRDRLDVESVTKHRMEDNHREPFITPAYPEENT